MRNMNIFTSMDQKKEIASFIEEVLATNMGKDITEVYVADESFEGDVLGEDIRIMFVVEGDRSFAEDTLEKICGISYEDLSSGTKIDAGIEIDNTDRGYGTIVWKRGDIAW